ncbi:fimbrial protein [Enterobacter cloacae]|uniref:fimbrial protein n=1 Tax=Enterobacter cloacae TaxID=550 RepID=UPI002FFB9073
MKKIAIIAAMSVAFTAAGVNAASTGTITFNGVVTSQTCNATVNGGNSNDGTITLPTVPVSALSTNTATAGQTAFTINVSSCTTTANANTVKAYFEKGANVDTNGRLTNTSTSTPASNVVLQLLEGTTPINIGDASQTTGTYVTIANNTATLPYSVRYYANGAAATAGNVSSSVMYSLVYK